MFDEATSTPRSPDSTNSAEPTRDSKNAASQVIRPFRRTFRGPRLGCDDRDDGRRLRIDDRRHVVNAGIQRGRDGRNREPARRSRLGVADGKVDVIATRGERLALTRTRFSPRDQRPGAFHVELLDIVEIDADGLIVGAASRSTSTTSTPPSPNSTPATSLAKQPLTRRRGRSSRRRYAGLNRHDSRRRHRTG